MAETAYNPDDPLEQAFLSALSLGETGNVADSSVIGVGGTNLSSVISAGNVDQYGFPIWQGQGNSHAAGDYQFEPSTWDSIASQFNLNFTSPGDQAEGAWYLAEQTDPNLYSDLQSGNYSAIQSALASVWPSVTGNGAAPQGLAASLANNVTTNTNAATAQTAANNASGATSSGATSDVTGSSGTGILAGIAGAFAQPALIVIGAVIIFVALWMLLSSQGVVPGPKEVAKDTLALGA
jgi:hypothetical protein